MEIEKFSLALILLSAAVCDAAPAKVRPVVFGRDIKPILAEKCFKCHGPDPGGRKDSSLRLDTEEGLRADLGGTRAVVPGDLKKSELYQRVTTTNAQDRMPFEANPLSEREIGLLRDWIEQGAKWEQHWSFVPPARPEPPQVKADTEIDKFIVQRLEEEGLPVPAKASPATLLRRVTLDLTGLPPTEQERAAFLADPSPAAYEKLVDRLLASPAYGEHMANAWLAAARYSDSNGDGLDTHRTMWPWRDWVVRAFNNNVPFDQFTIEQLAGDMLPEPSLEQIMATGFHRNHRGAADLFGEMSRLEYVADRVETTAMVWQGLTVACARCHSHKYDPITQVDYYRMMGYFNNVPEKAKLVTSGFGSRVYNSYPMVRTPSPAESQEEARRLAAVTLAQLRFDAQEELIVKSRQAWEKEYGNPARGTKRESIAGSPGKSIPDWSVPHGQLAHFAFENEEMPHWKAALAAKTTTAPIELPRFVPGLIGSALELKGKVHLLPDLPGQAPRRDLKQKDKVLKIQPWVKHMDGDDPWTISLWAYPKSDGPLYSHAADTCERRGISIIYRDKRVEATICGRWPDEQIRFLSIETVEPEKWHHIVVTYDGSREGRGLKLYINGELAQREMLWDEFTTPCMNTDPVKIGFYPPNDANLPTRFTGKIDELIIYGRKLSQTEIDILGTPTPSAKILTKPVAERTRGERAKLEAQFLEAFAPEPVRRSYVELRSAKERLRAYQDDMPTTMVMAEQAEPRKNWVYTRGEFDRPAQEVKPGVPEFLERGKAPGQSRLDFARWLVSSENPLTARVMVSRLWQQLFGTGLVRTAEDFGTQGEWPVHRELLDWLASEYVRRKWDTKAMLKLMVMSSAYQASSAATPELVQRDPLNRLLARGPRVRLTASQIRDQALAVSGLLVQKLGGPPVFPKQPDGFWSVQNIVQDYVPDTGEGQYRRSLYSFWKRSAAPPLMTVLDAPSRDTCRVKEERTNSPLQALVLLNEPGFADAASALAKAITATPGDDETRLKAMIRRVLIRDATADEIKIFKRHLDAQRKQKPDEAAAWVSAATLVLNLDETITKE